MVSSADVLRAVSTRVLPALLGAAAGGLLLTALASPDGLATLRSANWPMIPVRAVVVGAGGLLALLGVRRRLEPAALRSGARLGVTVACVGTALLVASIVVPRDLLVRGGVALGLLLDLGVGAGAALLAFLVHGRAARHQSPSGA